MHLMCLCSNCYEGGIQRYNTGCYLQSTRYSLKPAIRSQIQANCRHQSRSGRILHSCACSTRAARRRLFSPFYFHGVSSPTGLSDPLHLFFPCRPGLPPSFQFLPPSALFFPFISTLPHCFDIRHACAFPPHGSSPCCACICRTNARLDARPPTRREKPELDNCGRARRRE
jgi:hypothetical protein